jgi:hypothetical protein
VYGFVVEKVIRLLLFSGPGCMFHIAYFPNGFIFPFPIIFVNSYRSNNPKLSNHTGRIPEYFSLLNFAKIVKITEVFGGYFTMILQLSFCKLDVSDQ